MIKLLVDTGADTDKIYNLPYYINYNNITHFSNNKDSNDLIEYLINGELPEISQPPMMLWLNEIEPFLQQGYDILYISITKELSGGYKTFNIVRNLLKTKYSNRMEVIDSDTASTGTKLIAEFANSLLYTNDLDYIISETNKFKSTVGFCSISESMRYWINCGRLDCKEYKEGIPIVISNNNIMCLNKLCDSYEEGILYIKNNIIKDSPYIITHSPDILQDNPNICNSIITAVGGPKTICFGYKKGLQ